MQFGGEGPESDATLQLRQQAMVESLNKSCGEIVWSINMNNAYFNIFLLLVLLIEAAGISYLYVIAFLWIFDA